MTLRIPKLLFPITAVLCLAAGAEAATIGYTFTLVPAPTEINNYSLTLNKFDSSLGTLTGIQLYFKATETVTSFVLTNNSGSSQTFDAQISSIVNRIPGNTANAADAFSEEPVDLFDTRGGHFGLCPSVSPFACGSITLAAAANHQYGPFSASNTDAIQGFTTGTGIDSVFGVVQSVSAGNFSSYIASPGNTTFALTGSTLISTSFTGGGGQIGLSQTTTAGFQAEVDYTYTPASPTPEPATMGLLGSAMAGLFLFRKRFARKP
jgi:hypothetical protein